MAASFSLQCCWRKKCAGSGHNSKFLLPTYLLDAFEAPARQGEQFGAYTLPSSPSFPMPILWCAASMLHTALVCNGYELGKLGAPCSHSFQREALQEWGSACHPCREKREERHGSVAAHLPTHLSPSMDGIQTAWGKYHLCMKCKREEGALCAPF